MANTFKKVIDRMMWAQVAPSPNAHAAGSSMCADMRSDRSRNPFAYNLISNAILNRYNIVTKAWQLAINPALGGTFAFVGTDGSYTITYPGDAPTNDSAYWAWFDDSADQWYEATIAINPVIGGAAVAITRPMTEGITTSITTSMTG